MEEKNELTELILNELDLLHADGDMRKKIVRMIESGKAYLADKFGAPIDYDTDKQALELLISYCRYARSNAIEQFPHDFLSEINALAIRGAIKTFGMEKTSELLRKYSMDMQCNTNDTAQKQVMD